MYAVDYSRFSFSHAFILLLCHLLVCQFLDVFCSLAFSSVVSSCFAVGRTHAPAFASESSTLFQQTLSAVKLIHDPATIMNPGILLYPKDQSRL
jgi:hypothetical protein